MPQIRFRELIPDRLEAYGALDFDERGMGLAPRRLPAWTRLQMPSMMDTMVRMPSGVRLRFATDSRRVGIHFLATNMVNPPRPRRPVVFNCEVHGALQRAASTSGNAIILKPDAPGGFELVRGEPDTVRFDVPPDAPVCEIWLPHNAFVELRALEIDDGATLSRPACRDAAALASLRELDQPLHGGR